MIGHKNFVLSLCSSSYVKNDKEKCQIFLHNGIIHLKPPSMNIWPSKSIKQKKSLFTSTLIEKLSPHQLKFPPCLIWLRPPPPWLNLMQIHQMHVLCHPACTLICKSMQKSIAMITNFPHCHPGTPPEKEDFEVALGRKVVSHPQVCYKNIAPNTCCSTKKMSSPPMPNAIENPAEFSVDDSEVSSNGDSLNDTLKDVYEDNDATCTPSVSLFDSYDSENDDCKNGKQVQSDQQTCIDI